MTNKVISFCFIYDDSGARVRCTYFRGRVAVVAEACPPADTCSGRGPLAASYRAAMTQMTMGGSGVSEANGVLRNHYYPLSAI